MRFGRRKKQEKEVAQKPRMPVFDNSNPNAGDDTDVQEIPEKADLTPEEEEKLSRKAIQEMIRIGQKHEKNIDEFIYEAVPFVQKRNHWIYYQVFGNYMQQLGRYWEATESYKMAAEKAPEAKKSAMYNLVGQTYFMWNSKEYSEENRDNVILYLKKAGDLAEALNVLACTYDPNFKDTYYEKDPATALSYYYKAYKAYRDRDPDVSEEKSSVKEDLARIANNIGVIYGTDENNSLAAAAFAQAVSFLVPDNKTYSQNQKTYLKYVKKHYPEYLSQVENIHSVAQAEQFRLNLPNADHTGD